MTPRRWYQNVPIGGVSFEDPRREASKFWNQGKWHNFIEPLLPEERGTFVEIGCNAGLFLKMATDAGFRDVIGIEASKQIMKQAERFREHHRGDWKLICECIGRDFEIDRLPLADVTLLSNVHYYFPISVFADLVDRLKSRTLYCLIVSARARRRAGNAVHYLSAVRGYFRDWRETGVIEELEETGDPAPRQQMYGVCFKGNLDTCDVEEEYIKWRTHAAGSGKYKDRAIVPALDQFFKMVLAGEAFSMEQTLLYDYWINRSPGASPDWIRKKLEDKKRLAEDVQQNGLREPLYFDGHGKLLDGIHRLVIARELGYRHSLVRRL